MLTLNRTLYEHRRSDERARIDEGVIYEPRAWWDVVQIPSNEVPGQGDVAGRRTLREEHFRNGSRHKLVFTHVVVSPVNYMLQEYDTAPVDAQSFDNCGAVLSKMEWFISAPQRVELTNRDARSAALVPQATSLPPTRYDPAGHASSLFGVTRWTFERPMWLPQLGRIQIDLQSAPRTGADVGIGIPTVSTSVLFEERWGAGSNFTARQARYRPYASLPYASPASSFWPAGPQSFPPDAFAHNSPGAAAAWDPAGSFDGRLWARQEHNAGAAKTWYTGFAVAIDQIAHDDHIQASGIANVAGSPITMMAQRLGCRAKAINGGTNEWWWRPGAPLALVCPTLTPAQVWKLREPVTMAPTDSLRVEIQAPRPEPSFSPPINPSYQVGFSLCGYAVVEG